jgi:hypothetical protein
MQDGEIALSVGADAASACSVVHAVAAPPGVSSQALIKLPAELPARRVKAAILSNPEVKAVVPNRVVRIAQAFSAGVFCGSTGSVQGCRQQPGGESCSSGGVQCGRQLHNTICMLGTAVQQRHVCTDGSGSPTHSN